MVKYNESIPVAICPNCGGRPGIYPWEEFYYSECIKCGWNGGTRCIEPLPSSALDSWERKAIYHLGAQNEI